MMRSLFSGVAGLRTHQTRMDVIGNNIANVNTTSYKSQSMTFSDLMYQTTQAASGANAATGVGGINARQIGLGAKTSAIKTAISQPGSYQTTNDGFDLMITGDAFFIVGNGTVSQKQFTRDGSFYIDGAGNLAMTSTGYNVFGWGVDPTDPTAIKQDTVQPLRLMIPENMISNPEETTLATVSGVVDRNDTDVTGSGRVMDLEFYDKQGY
ncbi:MAG: flagellar hook-basal body complex protein, partial [Lachnospiraceae bacterium]|nr:flagellar hook-basal body complex protein [Lachnospiraceae bacterium]